MECQRDRYPFAQYLHGWVKTIYIVSYIIKSDFHRCLCNEWIFDTTHLLKNSLIMFPVGNKAFNDRLQYKSE